MTFTINAIHLYRRDSDEVRTVEFHANELNIITGASATGKSALLAIVDYCLASTGFHIPTGTIRRYVDKYALQIETDQGTFICARDAPAPGRGSTSTMYVGMHGELDTPARAALASNTDLATARRFLSSLANIDENVTSAGGGTRREYSAGIRHTLFFTLQSQSEVANANILFHSQNEEFVPQAIRDVLPYFLGAVDPGAVRKRELLRTVRRELRDIRQRIAENDGLRGSSGRSASLLAECVSLGLTSADLDFTSSAEIIQALSSVVELPSEIPFDNDESPTVLQELIGARRDLREALGRARSELESLRSLLSAHREFDNEVAEQSARLQTVGLLRHADPGERASCPLCSSHLDQPTPSVSALREQLAGIDREIAGVRQNAPNLQGLIGETESQIQLLVQQLRQNQIETNDVIATQEQLSDLRDLAISRATTRGRVSLYLESLSPTVEKGFLQERLISLERQEAELVEELGEEEAQSRLESALARVSLHMGEVVDALGTEYSGVPVRLDLAKLTVVVDTVSGPARLWELGSGANWLAYHLAAFIGLHRFFREQNRPVPRFLILDQPSQVYFPQDPTTESEVSDEDSRAVERVFRALYDFATGDSGFQVIIVDHADLSPRWFQNSVRERWRGHGLVPSSWIDDEPTSS